MNNNKADANEGFITQWPSLILSQTHTHTHKYRNKDKIMHVSPNIKKNYHKLGMQDQIQTVMHRVFLQKSLANSELFNTIKMVELEWSFVRVRSLQTSRGFYSQIKNVSKRKYVRDESVYFHHKFEFEVQQDIHYSCEWGFVFFLFFFMILQLQAGRGAADKSLCTTTDTTVLNDLLREMKRAGPEWERLFPQWVWATSSTVRCAVPIRTLGSTPVAQLAAWFLQCVGSRAKAMWPQFACERAALVVSFAKLLDSLESSHRANSDTTCGCGEQWRFSEALKTAAAAVVVVCCEFGFVFWWCWTTQSWQEIFEETHGALLSGFDLACQVCDNFFWCLVKRA